MIQINLLPGGPQRRSPAASSLRAPSLPSFSADPRVAGMGVFAVVVLVLAGLGWWTTGTARAEVQAQVDRETADSVRLARTIALMETLEARRDTIERKIDVIRSVDGRRYVWPHILDEVSRAVPPFTWLTKLAAGEEAPAPVAAAPAPGATPADSAATAAAAATAAEAPLNVTFSLEGAAGSTQALTRFMKNLEASPMVRDVALVTSEQTTTEGRSYLKFTLEARFEQPDS
ncbi:MAG TPA: PilN domain-containing protein, partial [Longimicrobium sp.]